VADKDQDAELSLAYVKHLVDLLCGRRTTPDSVHFEHKPISRLSVYLGAFGVEPLFEQPLNCIMFSRSLEDRRVQSADLQLFPVLRQHLVDMANATPREDDLLGSISHQIRQYLPLHQCTLKNVAGALALESQTLQRRLKAHDTVFADMVEKIRQEQAVDYLRGHHMEIKEISYMLGYGDPSAFVKAFRRWNGKTPSQYRELSR
jgi:AraC-like DNA-binding protein